MDVKVLKSQWDRVAAAVLTFAGAVCLLLGYVRVANSTLLAEQTRFIVSGGIGGVFLLGLGATLWVSADLRDEWCKLDRIERALGDGALRWVEDAERRASAPPVPATTEFMLPAANGAAPSGLTSASARDHA